MGDEGSSTPGGRRKRRDGVVWIVVSGLLLPASWLGWLLSAVAQSTGPMNERTTIAQKAVGDIWLVVMAAGIPFGLAVWLFVRGRIDHRTTWVGPVGCLVIAVLALGTTGVAAHSSVQRWHEDRTARAQPLTSLEVSRTPAQAAEELGTIGRSTVRALDADPAVGHVYERAEPCQLSNRHAGRYRVFQYVPPPPDDSGSPSARATPAEIGAAAVTERTRAAVGELAHQGLTPGEPDDRRIHLSGDGWLASADVTVDATVASVWIETTCLAPEAAR
jgi:hypothetical protein